MQLQILKLQILSSYLQEVVKTFVSLFTYWLEVFQYIKRKQVVTKVEKSWNGPLQRPEDIRFARTQNLKLYRDGRLFNVPVDLEEQQDISKSELTPSFRQTREMLHQVLSSSPPAPVGTGSRTSKSRPTYPDWRNLVDPND